MEDKEDNGIGTSKVKVKKKPKRVSLEEATSELMKDVGFQSLHINQVNNETLEFFKDLAHGEFKGDYGTTLKFLLESFSIHAHLRTVEMRMSKIENILDNLLKLGDVGDGVNNKGDVAVIEGDVDDTTEVETGPISLDGKAIKGW